MKLSKKTKVLSILTLLILAVSVIVAFAAPGDSNDPLITLSYITETLIPEMDSRINQSVVKKVDEAMSNYSSPSQNESSSFVLVNVKKNQRIVGGEGSEFLVRAGTGVIVATSSGGIADLTIGTDLTDGTQIPLNHHLLCPRNDSRGLKFTTDAIVLIKGSYTVKSK